MFCEIGCQTIFRGISAFNSIGIIAILSSVEISQMLNAPWATVVRVIHQHEEFDIFD